ncbi:MAG: redoxin domain-containing protein, partial [Dehalococcoidia bacterium]
GDIYLIGPETQENALKLREKTESTIPLLFDDQAEVCRQFGLAFELPSYFQEAYSAAGNDLPAANPGAGWTLPIPATFVIGPSGRIAARLVDPDYTKRMEPSEILAAARTGAGATE